MRKRGEAGNDERSLESKKTFLTFCRLAAGGPLLAAASEAVDLDFLPLLLLLLLLPLESDENGLPLVCLSLPRGLLEEALV